MVRLSFIVILITVMEEEGGKRMRGRARGRARGRPRGRARGRGKKAVKVFPT